MIMYRQNAQSLDQIRRISDEVADLTAEALIMRTTAQRMQIASEKMIETARLAQAVIDQSRALNNRL
ncbi:hypothetical protein PSJ8397_01081 [Pseudooctadecabacter jejudonensis]|uniref:Uncharacterized protein n=2 Tax=Pseudooctadecabacter jejudonensis TaxID=1391910 RepID=A0A1Y5RWD2_9RHOB|nr:hypothetical protein PSJ8397_01081 [Pseudooctadecabacter jejudonensis]